VWGGTNLVSREEGGPNYRLKFLGSIFITTWPEHRNLPGYLLQKGKKGEHAEAD